MGGDLREVGDGEDLALLGDGAHFCADGVSDFAADVGVNLVEHEQRDGVLRGERGFHGEHDARNFAARCDGLERLGGLAGIWREYEFDALQTMRAGLGEGVERDGEVALFETEIAQVSGDALGELRRGGGAFVGELRGGGEHDGALLFDLAGEALDFLASAFDLLQAGGGGFAESDHVRDGAAVFALERLEERHALLHLGERAGLDVEFLGVTLEDAGEVFDFGEAACECVGKTTRAVVHTFEIAQEFADFAEPRERCVVGLHEPSKRGGGKLQQLARVRGDSVAREQFLLFAGLDLRVGDFADLMTEQIEFAFERGFASGKCVALVGEAVEFAVLLDW